MDTIHLQHHIRTMPARRLKELEAGIEERDGVRQLLGKGVDKRMLELIRYFIGMRRGELDRLELPDKQAPHCVTLTTRNWGRDGYNSKVKILGRR